MQLEPSESAGVAVIYAAKSTTDVHESIPRQLVDCRQLAEREGREIIEEFSDENMSAWKGNRGDGLANAKVIAESAASEHGTCALIVQHTDRLARGDGKRATHLVELALWARRADVEILSVQDPQTCQGGLAFAAAMGDRNEADSSRKSAAVSSGLQGAARRGDWVGGILADGYRVIRRTEGPRVVRTILFDPDRKEIFDLLWDLARAGYSSAAIAGELQSRGYRTSPRKRNHRSRPFDSNRIRQVLDNPFYAGLSYLKGEYMGPGHWPAYVTPEDFERLRRERRAKGNVDRRQVGRPPEGYALARLASCGACGSPMTTETGRKPRADGTRSRRYVCSARKEHANDCSALPIDARPIDASVIDQLATVLGDVDDIRAGIAAARGADRSRLEAEAAAASEEAIKTERGLEAMQARILTLYAAGEHGTGAALEATLERGGEMVVSARRRQDAALDALSGLADDEAPDEEAFWAQLRDSIETRLDGARDDLKRLNLALSDFLESVELHRQPDGSVRVVPNLSDRARDRILRDVGRWPHGASRIVEDDDGNPIDVPVGSTPEDAGERHLDRTGGERGYFIIEEVAPPPAWQAGGNKSAHALRYARGESPFTSAQTSGGLSPHP